jgi:branched-subunit amino acid ABC-type transport system permease component
MIDRLKHVLVESFIGAIALGYILAEVVLYFTNMFTAPLSTWGAQYLYLRISPSTALSSGLYLRAAASPATGFVILLIVWYILLRWLYFRPLKKVSDGATPS